MRELLRVSLVATCLLAGCGMKGPLYLPDEEPVTGSDTPSSEPGVTEEDNEDERRGTNEEGGGS
jgi:predicted small lipoprotein YifL